MRGERGTGQNINGRKRRESLPLPPLNVYPRPPSKKHKDMGLLTREQRYAISVMRAKGCTRKEMADMLCRDKSAVCRELRRNGNPKTREYTFYAACARCKARQAEEDASRHLPPTYFSPDIRLPRICATPQFAIP